jgi:hypothetical protein
MGKKWQKIGKKWQKRLPDDSTESSLQEILFPPGGRQGGKTPSSN